MIGETLTRAGQALQLPPLRVSGWDIVLLAVVSVMGTAMAYIPTPRWKVLVLSLPLPFTIATLSLGLPVGPSHALGLLALLLFTHLVRWLHYGLRLAIVPAIVASALTYITLGVTLNRLVPPTTLAFWLSLGLAIALGIALLALVPPREETPHRSPLPVPVKLVTTTGVVAVLVLLKNLLGGFMTIFPLVGIVAAYEARHSLWATGRQLAVTMVTVGPMMGLIWVLQHRAGASIAFSLAAGWLLFPCILVPVTLIQNRQAERAGRPSATAGP